MDAAADPTPRWLVLRYMADVPRRETVNLGVILIAPERHTRFLPDEDAAQVVASVANYRAWVEWLEHALADSRDPSELLSSRAGDNYLVEHSGWLLFGAVDDCAALADRLYEQLVGSPRYRVVRELRDAVDAGGPVDADVARRALEVLDRSAQPG